MSSYMVKHQKVKETANEHVLKAVVAEASALMKEMKGHLHSSWSQYVAEGSV